MKLALHLQQELIELGLQDVNVTKHAVVTAYLSSNHPDLTHTIGFISHLDTSPQCSGKNVQPEVIENYRGGDIALGLGEEFISPVYYPFLHQLIGKTLIVTDGTTLLGADNKAIVAEQKKIQAQGDAEATRIKAEADAEANAKIAASLTSELIEKQKIEKWNGSVPQVQGDSTPIVKIAE